MNLLFKEVSDKILKAFYNVFNELGFGFLEKVYERFMMIELKNLGLKCEAQKKIDVYFKNQIVGEYFADITVEDKIILELKSAESIIKEHEAQVINYLKATLIEVGFILNFGKEPKFKRMIFENKFKSYNLSV